MKKLLLCALVLLSVKTIKAQNKKGDLLLKADIGSSGITFGNSEQGMDGTSDIYKMKSTGFNITIGPSAGLYLTDNFVLGTFLGISFLNSSSEYTSISGIDKNKNHNINLSVGPFARLYFGNNNRKGMPFTQLNTGFTFYPSYHGSYNQGALNGYTYKLKDHLGLNAALNIGYEHFLNNSIGLEYYIGYSYLHSRYKYFYYNLWGADYTSTYKSNSSNINLGVSLSIHLQWKKKNKK